MTDKVVPAQSVEEGYKQITDLSAAVGLGSIPTNALRVFIIPEGADVRWRDDGTNPTAAIGMPLAVGQPLDYTGADLTKIKFIEQTGGAKLNCVFYNQ